MLNVYDLSGPVDLRTAELRTGELGSVTDALIVAAGPGGALIALTGALVSWLRHRTADVTLTLVRPDGSAMKIDGRRVRGLDAEQVNVMIDQLAAQLADPTVPVESAPPEPE
jgi:cysteine synthase